MSAVLGSVESLLSAHPQNLTDKLFSPGQVPGFVRNILQTLLSGNSSTAPSDHLISCALCPLCDFFSFIILCGGITLLEMTGR